jgi:hypothetical protein
MEIEWDIPEEDQASTFMNATLGSFAEGVAISIAVHLACPPHINPTDRPAVEAWLRETLALATERGSVAIQIGAEESN